MLYKFDTGAERNTVFDLTEKSEWFGHCKAAGLNNMHSSTIGTILNQITNNLEFSKAVNDDKVTEAAEEPPLEGKNKKSKAKKTAPKAANGSTVSVEEVCDKFVEQTAFFEDAIVREQIFQLQTLRTITKTEF